MKRGHRASYCGKPRRSTTGRPSAGPLPSGAGSSGGLCVPRHQGAARLPDADLQASARRGGVRCTSHGVAPVVCDLRARLPAATSGATSPSVKHLLQVSRGRLRAPGETKVRGQAHWPPGLRHQWAGQVEYKTTNYKKEGPKETPWVAGTPRLTGGSGELSGGGSA